MAAAHSIGYCKIVVESATGETVRDDEELFVISRAGLPQTGNWITIAKIGRYFIDRVEFLPEETARLRNFVYPTLFLRPAGARRTSPTEEGTKRSTTVLSARHDNTRKVIAVDFAGGADASRLGADILPAALVANLVTVGYRVQASDFDDERHIVADQLRDADERLRDATVAILDTLSREAKSHAVQCQLFFGGVSVPAVEQPPSTLAGGRRLLSIVRDDAGDWRVDAA